MPKKIGFSRYEENFPGSDVTAAEWEFMQAMARYQRRHGRRYPSWREVLGVLKQLGYQKPDPPAAPVLPHDDDD